MEKQPKSLYIVNFVSMWECFSFYGMRVLLVLFMVHEYRYSDEKAFGMYALYTTLVELGGVFGGIVADRYLGLKRSIATGALLLMFGHLLMAFHQFFLGLGCIITGSSLFRSNIAAFLGQLYTENDPRRDAGYTLYYTGINLGGFLATTACAVVGEAYGWHAGFSLAGLGMLFGLIALGFLVKVDKKALIQSTIACACIAPVMALMLYYHSVVAIVVPIAIGGAFYYMYKELAAYRRLGLYLLFLVIFYACEEQLGSSLVLFAERHVERGIIPAASLITCNPLTILLVGPFFSRLMPFEGMKKITMSFVMLAGAFFTLWLACIVPSSSFALTVSSVVLISVGELCIGPTVYAMASSMAPKAHAGLLMGAVALGYSLANYASGFLSQLMAVAEPEKSIDVYTHGFLTIAIAASVVTLITWYIKDDRSTICKQS
ncbi:MAG: peptide MFS transporter [Verrucomicrobia bacterium]|nr:peptide MFS transporter [Verrucomicrobiota bacterium]MBS0636478.1 peptide MFS transporter [Verrucomicrobiota bacterium]